MKKFLVAVMAIMMTVGVMAQCPHQKACPQQKAEECKVKKECVKQDCVYSPETRAMMRVDRLSQVIKDLTENERKQLLDFYKAHFIKCEKRKTTANPMTKEECKKECQTELRKILGDDRYIQYLESEKKCGKGHCDKGPNRPKPCPGKCHKPCPRQ